jgi:23S rRNA (pseudouridine1915-N3)-methyltransferase
MRLIIGAIGRLKNGAERELLERYIERARRSGRAAGVTEITIVELGESRAASTDARRTDEAQRLFAAIGADAYLVALDERGKGLTSAAFAELIRQQGDGGCKSLAFLIGGPDGHGAGIASAAQRIISFGSMTLPHGLARVVLAEQIYRATTILTGHPYHRA